MVARKTFAADPHDLDALAQDIAISFNISAEHLRRQQIRTVGELYDYILQEIPAHPRHGSCLTAVAFYRIRRALRELTGEIGIKPDSLMEDLIRKQHRSLPEFWANIQSVAGVNLPPLGWRFRFRIPPFVKSVPHSSRTVGGLAKTTFAFNFRRLVDQVDSFRDKDAWDALSLLCRHYFSYPDTIDRDTSFH